MSIGNFKGLLMELLSKFSGDFLSLIIIGIFMLAITLTNNGYLTKLLKRRGQPISELANRMDEIEKQIVPNLDDILARIENKLDSLSTALGEMEQRLNYIDKTALMGVIYTDNIHITDRLRAFNSYIRLGGNGLVMEFATYTLIIPNWNDWQRVSQESRMKIYCGEDKYNARLAEIEKKYYESKKA